jgi:hypothetical protein
MKETINEALITAEDRLRAISRNTHIAAQHMDALAAAMRHIRAAQYLRSGISPAATSNERKT